MLGDLSEGLIGRTELTISRDHMCVMQKEHIELVGVRRVDPEGR